ncbi:2-C-methyl-D-erythritol 4-phosphate cytidylyltransferase [bacterium HR11]|nr:2-C-methyl-D-erythritol 4-phosphate cytidylyltransferase [bacterium HR11]
MPEVIAIVVAAGIGRRLGAVQPKAWVPLKGRPLLAWTLEALSRWDLWTRWVIVHPPGIDLQDLQAVEATVSVHPPIQWVPGGVRRQDSVWNGLQAVSAPDDSVVMVHDGARPFVPGVLIQRLWEAVQVTGAAVPVLPVLETVKVVEARRVVQTLDRDRLFLSQTPQAFRLDLLRQAYRFVQEQGTVVTDEAAAVERLGHAVTAVEGFRWNIKVTYPEDLQLAAWLIDTGIFQSDVRPS